jgi:hypothetical protein
VAFAHISGAYCCKQFLCCELVHIIHLLSKVNQSTVWTGSHLLRQ